MALVHVATPPDDWRLARPPSSPPSRLLVRRLFTTAFALAVFLAHPGIAQDTLLVRALQQSSASFAMVDGSLRGAGAERLAAAAREHQFILVGEEHGIAEVPAFVAALFETAKPAGYRHLAIEIGPVTGRR